MELITLKKITKLIGFYNYESGFFLTQGDTAFFCTKFYVKRPVERCLIQDFE